MDKCHFLVGYSLMRWSLEFRIKIRDKLNGYLEIKCLVVGVVRQIDVISTQGKTDLVSYQRINCISVNSN
jgi:hypothetical protein